MTGDRARSTVGPALAGLTTAAEHLTAWHAAADGYVRAGHDAIAAIDRTLRALYDAREQLVTEIHQDDIERAARVDELLARARADRFRDTDDQAAADPHARPTDTSGGSR